MDAGDFGQLKAYLKNELRIAVTFHDGNLEVYLILENTSISSEIILREELRHKLGII